MLFVDQALAARIEGATTALLRDAVACVARRQSDGNVLREDVAGGVAVFTEPGSPLNKITGVGFAGPIDEAQLARLEQRFADVDEPVRVEVATVADPGVAEMLTRRGCALVGFENVLGVALPVRELSGWPKGLELEESLAVGLDAWMDVVVTGFARPDAGAVGPPEVFDEEMLRRIIRDFAQAAGVLRYLARREGVPVGGASMHLFEGVAQLCGAATLPAHRRRGVQTAMLAHRLALAAAAGCDVAVITTQPASRSQQNAQRRGFELLYARAVLVRGA